VLTIEWPAPHPPRYARAPGYTGLASLTPECPPVFTSRTPPPPSAAARALGEARGAGTTAGGEVARTRRPTGTRCRCRSPPRVLPQWYAPAGSAAHAPVTAHFSIQRAARLRRWPHRASALGEPPPRSFVSLNSPNTSHRLDARAGGRKVSGPWKAWARRG